MVPINFLAVLVSAVAAMAIGAVWYGPLFGKEWARGMGLSPQGLQEAMKRSGAKSYSVMAVGAFLMAFILDHTIAYGSMYLGISGIAAGLIFGFASWLGFIAPATINSVIWENKPVRFWLITSGYYLVTILVMSVILGSWA